MTKFNIQHNTGLSDRFAVMSDTTTSPLLVPRGTRLIPGKLYVQLYHGRKDPAQEVDDWGFDGPTFGPLLSVVQTYFATGRLCRREVDDDLWLDVRNDMIVWDDSYYGHLAIFVAKKNDRG